MEKIELLKLIHSADLDSIADELSDLNESQRRKLSTTASKWGRFLAQHGLGWEIKGAAAKLKELSEMGIDASTRHPLWDQAADLAILGCCPISQAKKVNFIFSHDRKQRELTLKILSDRNPDWVDELVEFKLTQRAEFPVISWNFINDLIQRGVCKKPDCDEYIVAMTNTLGYFANDQEFEDQVQLFVANPDFFAVDIYKIFDVDSHAFIDTYRPEGQTWGSLIHRWLGEGKLERSKVIECSLRGMSQMFKKNVISGFCKFFDSLKPKPDELQNHIPRIGSLLSNQNGSVVNAALKQLKALHKSELIQSAELLELLPAIFDCATKSQPNSALTLIQTIGTKEPQLIPSAINAALTGLNHANSDIQEKTLNLLEKWADRAHSDHAIVIAQQLDSLSPSLVSQAKAIMVQLGSEAVCEDTNNASLDELRNELSELDRSWVAVTRLHDLFDDLENEQFPPPLDHSIFCVPVLTGLEPLDLIGSADELIDRIAHAVEQVDSGIEAEILLDGIANHGLVHGSGEYSDRVQPILKRIENQEQIEGARGFLNSFDVAPAALPLFQLALGKTNTKGFEDWSNEKDNKKSIFFNARIESLFKRLKSHGNFQPLSTPTHARGWIDPLVFVDRCNDSFAGNSKIDQLDFVLALLRLAPDNRELALQDLSNECPEDLKFVIQLALGAEFTALQCATKADNLLVNIAAHVRAGELNDEQCKQLNVHAKLVNGKGPSIMSWNTRIDEIKSWSESLHDQERLDSKCDLLPPLSVKPFQYMFWAFQGVKRYDYWEFGAGWRFQLDDWNSKLSNDHYLLRAAHKLQIRIDDNSSIYDPNSDMLEALFEPDRVWSEIAHLSAVMSLIGKDCDALGVGMDATIDAIQQGRANPIVMGQVIVKLFEHWSRRGRLAKSLAEIARMSALHAWFVASALEPLIQTFDPMPRDGAKVLEVYLDCLVTLKLASTEEVRKVLAPIKGSSKAAKLAKKIVALEQGEPSARLQAKEMAAQARIERVKRWENAAMPTLAH